MFTRFIACYCVLHCNATYTLLYMARLNVKKNNGQIKQNKYVEKNCCADILHFNVHNSIENNDSKEYLYIIFYLKRVCTTRYFKTGKTRIVVWFGKDNLCVFVSRINRCLKYYVLLFFSHLRF